MLGRFDLGKAFEMANNESKITLYRDGRTYLFGRGTMNERGIGVKGRYLKNLDPIQMNLNKDIRLTFRKVLNV